MRTRKTIEEIANRHGGLPTECEPSAGSMRAANKIDRELLLLNEQGFSETGESGLSMMAAVIDYESGLAAAIGALRQVIAQEGDWLGYAAVALARIEGREDS